MRRALFEVWPALTGAVPLAPLADLPTPVQALPELGPGAFVKRDDLTSPIYGGNKVRTLEVLFGRARADGAEHILATGAYGSNHAVATVLHAARAGLRAGAMLFPQPPSQAALENLEVVVAKSHELIALPHWSVLPAAMWWTRRSWRRSGIRGVMMVPGGATPAGALGYVNAALELAAQVRAGELPEPAAVVIGVGSTCTSAGLLLGLRLAVDLGSLKALPELVSVRVTPWPVTAPWRIAGLAARTSRLLATLAGDPRLVRSAATLAPGLAVDAAQLGRGYGVPTRAGAEATRRFAPALALDTTYSAKSAAGFLTRLAAERPVVFWATKSTAPLPPIAPADLARAPPAMRRWMERARTVASAARAPA